MIKRLFDIIGSLFGLIVFSPLLLVLYFAIRRDMGAPVLFRQIRPGKDGKPFEMVKFRSMRDAADADGNALPDAERLTPLGRKLRSSSADELPELWNVLKGEMSLVGPRPLLVEYLPYYTHQERQRNRIQPGITGLAQVYGRNRTPWNKRLALDLDYVENQTFLLDLKIIFKTLQNVVKRENVVTDPRTIMQDLNVERAQLIEIRQLEIHELQSAADLIAAEYTPDHYSCTIISSPKLGLFFAEHLIKQDEFWGAFRNAKLIGVMQLRQREDDVHLNNIAVKRDEQGWGIADLLMKQFHKNYPNRKKSLFLDSRNSKARRFYERYGYKLSGVEKMVELRATAPKAPTALIFKDKKQIDRYGIGFLTDVKGNIQIGYITPDRLAVPIEAGPSGLKQALNWREGARIWAPAVLTDQQSDLTIQAQWDKMEFVKNDHILV